MTTMTPTRILMLLTMLRVTHGEYKVWLANTNFGNPSNWNAGRSPCGNDVVIVPDESPVIYMQVNTTIKELALPKNGELIFDKNTVLGFTNTPSADCTDFGGEVEFSAVNPAPWLSPASWCSASTARGQCDVTAAKLDVERVPGTFDDVVFPRGSLYFVDLSDVPPQMAVKSLKLAGASKTSQTFNDLLNSTEGKLLFRTPSSTGTAPFSITRKSCDDNSGCAGGNDRPQISKKICQYVAKTCKRPRCQKTIQPVGSCCKMCGAIFNITRGYGFNLDDFRKLINDKFFKEPSGVNMTSSIMSEGWLQMVLSDLTGEKSSKLGFKIKADFDADIASGGHRYAIGGIQFSLATGPPIGPRTSANTGSQLGGGSIAGIFFAVVIAIIVILAIVVIFVYKRQGKPLPMPTARLPTLPALPKLPALPRLPIMFRRRQGRYVSSRGPDQPQTAAHVDPGFANPLYDSSPFDDRNAVAKEMKMMDVREVQPTFDTSDGGFNNPLYASQQGGASVAEASHVEPSTGEAGGQASDPDASAVSSTHSATGILIDTHADGEEPDSTI